MEESLEWLNQDYLGLVLKESVEDGVNSIKDFEVVEYKANCAVEKGKNFTSTVYRVEVWYKQNANEVKKKNYIIKKLHTAYLGSLGDKETEVYKVLQKIEQYVNCKIAPKLYLYKDDSLVMQDLSEQGFQTTTLLLDYPHCKLVVQALAKFHAGSVSVHQNDPKMIEAVSHEMYINNPITDFFEKNIIILGNIISTWSEIQKYAEFMPIIAKQITKYFENLSKRDCFKVLNHGDFHMNNMMFRYESGKVCEVRLIDFQVCRFAPPTCDLQYFFSTGVDLDVRLNRLDELLNVYLDTFNDTLTGLGISRNITKQQFEDSFKEDYMMYFVGLSLVTAYFANPETMFTGLEEKTIEEDNNGYDNLMKSEEFKLFITTVLNSLDKSGVFQRYHVKCLFWLGVTN